METGHYEIDADGIAANKRLRAKHPDTNPMALFAIRIGYDAVYSFGGAGIRRTRNLDEDGIKDYSTQRHEWRDGFDVETLVAQILHKRDEA